MAILPANSERYPMVQTLDLNFDKAIRLGGARRIVLNAAIFNISNTNTTLALARRAPSTASAWRVRTRRRRTTCSTIVGPRVIRFGIRVNF